MSPRLASGSARSWRAARAGALVALAGASAALAGPSCIRDGYPLSSGARVTMTMSVGNGILYAADVLGPDRKPLYPRQTPSSMVVTLQMSEDQEAAYGGFVDIVVTPPDLLALSSADDGEEPTCIESDGFFRCTANSEGMARFIVTSEADKSGDAVVSANWATDKQSTVQVTVAPAGIPPGSTVAINNIHQNDVIRATGKSISCYEQGIPEDIDTEWRDGFVRVTPEPLTIQVTAPLDSPAAVENAPLYISTDDATAALSFDPSCNVDARQNELRLQLDILGKSNEFYACFSDLGGSATFSTRSGSPTKDPVVRVDVRAEPRLLRIENLLTEVELQPTTIQTDQDVFVVAVFGVHEVPMDLTVRLDLNDHVLRLNNQLVNIQEASGGSEIGTIIRVTPVAPGTAQLGATPFIYPQPTCKSKQVTVIAPQ